MVAQGAALLGEALGLAIEPVRSVLFPDAEEAVTQARRTVAEAGEGKPFFLLAPAAGWGAKQWPAECFGALARALGERGFAVLVNAASSVEPVSQAVAVASGGVARVVCCSVAELMTLTRRAAVVVGGDSGPVHLAAALGTPVVALYGPTDPERNGPWGPGAVRVLRDRSSVTSHKRTAAAEAGLARITVEEVVAAVLQGMGGDGVESPGIC